MMKRLFLITALLLPGLAYGQTQPPSAQFSDQVVPATSGPSVPAPAQAAGFTTNVLNADFTTPGNFWSNTANYIVNCGAADSVPGQPSAWHFYFRNYFTQAALPCATNGTTTGTRITTDTTGGGNQALEMILTAADFGAGTIHAYLAFPDYINSLAPWMPNEVYTRVVYREDSGSLNQSASVYGVDVWWAQNVNFGQWVDQDWAELVPFAPNSCSSTQVFFQGKFDPGPVSGASPIICTFTSDFTNYHTLETLTTSDESSDMTLCEWLDGTFKGCTSVTLPSGDTAAYTKHDLSVYMSETVIPGVTTINNDLHIFIQSIEIWSCPNFATQTCPGTIVNHWPIS